MHAPRACEADLSIRRHVFRPRLWQRTDFFFYAGVVGETGSWCQTGLWFLWNLVCSFINRWHQQVSRIFVWLETSQTSTGQRTEHWLMSSSVKPLVTWSLFKWQKTLWNLCAICDGSLNRNRLTEGKKWNKQSTIKASGSWLDFVKNSIRNDPCFCTHASIPLWKSSWRLSALWLSTAQTSSSRSGPPRTSKASARDTCIFPVRAEKSGRVIYTRLT